MTFDDGPGPYTGRLLDILAAGKARATFFVLGSGAARDPATVRRIRQEGHELANHTYTHVPLTSLSTREIQGQLMKTQQAVQAASGVWPRLMRPPYGATDKRVTRVAQRMNLPQILWSIDTMDWRVRKAKSVAARATQGAHSGAIILLHDIHRTSVEAVPPILNQLRRGGFTFVSVSELYANKPLAPGKRYSSGSG